MEQLGRGGVLAVDDAHLLDDVSGALVHQLARTAEISLLVTVRTGEPAPDAVHGLWKDELLERLELQPLSRDETRVLLESALGEPVSDTTVRRFYEASLGNALLLRELVFDARDSGELVDRDGNLVVVRPGGGRLTAVDAGLAAHGSGRGEPAPVSGAGCAL